MADKKKPTTTEECLSSMPAKDAGPDEWRWYHEALFKAGKLAIAEPAKEEFYSRSRGAGQDKEGAH